MNITVNEKSIAYVLNEQRCKNEIKYYLNRVIDVEIEKENPDTELLDNCTELLFALETGDTSSLPSAENMLMLCQKNANKNSGRAKQIAAAIMIMLVATGALLQANPAIAQQTRDLFSQIAYVLGISADDSENGESIKSLYAVFETEPNTTIHNENEIDLSILKVIAVDNDGNEYEVPLEKCEITKTPAADGEKTKLILTVAYKGAAFSITYTIEG